MPRILHVITGLAIGGAETALYRLIVGSRGGEYSHTVVSLTPGGAMRRQFDEAGIETMALDFRPSPLSPLLQFVRLIALIRKHKPDIVQTWMYHADMLGGLAARLSGNRKVIWGIRTSGLNGDSMLTATVARICAWLSHWVPHTIVCVAEASRRAHAIKGYDPARMVVVHNGFDFSGFAATIEERVALRTQCGFSDDHVVIGNIGRFDLDKDQQNFVRAAGFLSAQYDHVRFLMVGPGVDERNAKLAEWIAATPHPDRFVLLGPRMDVPVCLAAMDLFCLSSRNEGFPNAIGEAMAMGLPCVSTDAGDAAFLIGDTGTVVPKEDSAALARGLAATLALSVEGRKRLGRRAQHRVQSEFNIAAARARFESVYRQVAGGEIS